MSVNNESPRVLRLTFDLHIPAGLRRNVHWTKVEAAIATFVAVIQAAATRAFPWATKMRVTHEWIYLWNHESEWVELATTEFNTGPYKDQPDES